MAGYTPVNKQIIDGILSLYGDESVSEWIPMAHGISNSNFKIITRNNKEFLLKISNDKTYDELGQELQILSSLKENNYPHSIAPFKTQSGNSVFGYEDHYGVLFPFVYGSTPQISNSTCEQLGEALAKLHETSVLNKIRNYKEIGQDFLSIKQYLSQSPNKEFKDKAQFFLDNLDFNAFESQELPKGIIHGDLYYDNTLFKNESLEYVLDFEQAGYGTLLLDIGISISGSCLDKDSQISHELVEDFLKGYQRIRPLTLLEAGHINHAIILGLLSVSLWRVIRFNEKQIAKNKEESFKELLHRADNFYRSL